MRSYKKLQQEYKELEAKYDRLLGEKLESEYKVSQWKTAAENARRQDDEVRVLHENIRHLKHDMKNHVMVIASYLNSQEFEQARQYTSQILDKLNAVHSYIETGNSLLNHILNEKLNDARSKGIGVKAEIETLSFARMESLDFSALLSNLLDNAIEGSMGEEMPELVITISKRRGYETIFVKNRISHSVLEHNPRLESTKEDTASHGMGIGQIRALVEKYEGMCDFLEEDGFFCACVFIPI